MVDSISSISSFKLRLEFGRHSSLLTCCFLGNLPISDAINLLEVVLEHEEQQAAL